MNLILVYNLRKRQRDLRNMQKLQKNKKKIRILKESRSITDSNLSKVEKYIWSMKENLSE